MKREKKEGRQGRACRKVIWNLMNEDACHHIICVISSSSYHMCNIIFRWWLRISNGPTGILSGERGRGGDCDNGDHRHGNLGLVGDL